VSAAAAPRGPTPATIGRTRRHDELVTRANLVSAPADPWSRAMAPHLLRFQGQVNGSHWQPTRLFF
jgi:hypothetical protein